MIDKNGKLFGLINVIDLFVVLMIVILVIAIVLRTQNINVLTEKGEMEYVLRIDGAREIALPYFEVGLQVFDKVTSSPLGEIVAVESVPFVDRIVLSDGQSKMTEKPNHVQILLTIKAPIEISEKAYLAFGNYEIKAGSNVEIRTKFSEAMTKVLEIQKITTDN